MSNRNNKFRSRASLLREIQSLYDILKYNEEVEKLKVHNTVKAINARRREKELAKTNDSEGQEEGK